MAKTTIIISDLTGEQIDGATAQVQITLSSKPNSRFLIDANEAEVAELVARAREQKRRGRPKSK